MQDQRNLLLAIVASVVILFGFQIIFGDTPPPAPAEGESPTVESVETPGGVEAPVAAPDDDGLAEPAVAIDDTVDREQAIGTGERVQINPNRDIGRLYGSIALRGGRLDDVVLAQYRETTEPDSPPVVILAPEGTRDPYFADFGWVAARDTPATVPNGATEWQADGLVLTAQKPVTLTWDNGEGLVFSRRFAVDADFMFTVTDTVDNRGETPVTLHAFGRINRTGTPETSGMFILHEGPLGVFDGTLEEVDYDDLQDGEDVRVASTVGWIGITDKYWLTALIPDQDAAVRADFTHTLGSVDGRDRYQVDMLDAARTVAPGDSVSVGHRVFAGAKEVLLLDRYEEELGIPRFDLAVDFGWFYFLTKPLFYAIHYLYNLLGNFGLAILALTVGVKIVFFPLANKSYKAMSKLKKLQPKMLKLRKQYQDDRQKLNQEMMKLYKAEKANPLAGCLPILVQIPVFFALYKVLFVAIEMRQAPFYGWIKDLSAPDPTSLFNVFGLLPFDPPSFLMIGVWPVLMGATMFLQQKLNPAPPDPMQAKVMMMLPFVFTFLFATFPAGMVIYWTWNNMLSIAQQWLIMRRMGVKV